MKSASNKSTMYIKIYKLLMEKPFMQKFRLLYYIIDSILMLFVKKPLKINNSKKQVLIIYNIALGDGVIFLSIADELRRIYKPDKYEISLAFNDKLTEFYENYGYFDHLLPLDFAGSSVNLKKRLNLFRNLKKIHYDIVLDPIGCEDCTTNVFVTRATSADIKIGIDNVAALVQQCPQWLKKKAYTNVIKINDSKIHLIHYYGEFVKALRDKNYLSKPAYLKITTSIEKYNLPEKYFIIFPTSSLSVKNWPIEYFAKLTEAIYRKTNIPVLFCGTNHDKDVVDNLKQLIPDVTCIDIIDKTNTMEFIEVIRNASFIVSNDTSAYHIAVATKTPVAIICGGYTFSKYTNYSSDEKDFQKPILIVNQMPCFDCNYKCIYKNYSIYPCLKNITFDYAWEKIENLIEESR